MNHDKPLLLYNKHNIEYYNKLNGENHKNIIINITKNIKKIRI